MFSSILNTGNLTLQTAVICTFISLLLGFVIALIYMRDESYSKGFLITLVILPALIQVVIMMVNGNLGTGIAVLGAFSLVRFRSVPGNSLEISSLFFAMAVGLATGMGQIFYAVLITVFIGGVMLVLTMSSFGEKGTKSKELKVLVPENLNYDEAFLEVFERYLKKVSLIQVKSVNMGSLYELHYTIKLKDITKEREMIEKIHSINGNLTIICSRVQISKDEL